MTGMQGKAGAGPWHAATRLAPFGLLGPVLLGFCVSLTSSQFSSLLGLGHSSQPLIPIYWKQAVTRHAGVRGPLPLCCWLNRWVSGCSEGGGRP